MGAAICFVYVDFNCDRSSLESNAGGEREHQISILVLCTCFQPIKSLSFRIVEITSKFYVDHRCLSEIPEKVDTPIRIFLTESPNSTEK